MASAQGEEEVEEVWSAAAILAVGALLVLSSGCACGFFVYYGCGSWLFNGEEDEGEREILGYDDDDEDEEDDDYGGAEDDGVGSGVTAKKTKKNTKKKTTNKKFRSGVGPSARRRRGGGDDDDCGWNEAEAFEERLGKQGGRGFVAMLRKVRHLRWKKDRNMISGGSNNVSGGDSDAESDVSALSDGGDDDDDEDGGKNDDGEMVWDFSSEGKKKPTAILLASRLASSHLASAKGQQGNRGEADDGVLKERDNNGRGAVV
mmetsp:Transcript_14147/g.28975  ORF Transcript_14147/g.28975 Transcript_14147/m.28975 type:complete len:260 (+) Transcript_14147:190-969(+)